MKDVLKDTTSKNILYLKRDISEESSRIATDNEKINLSKDESYVGDTNQTSKMLMAMGSTKDEIGLKEVHGPEKIQISYQSQDRRDEA